MNGVGDIGQLIVVGQITLCGLDGLVFSLHLAELINCRDEARPVITHAALKTLFHHKQQSALYRQILGSKLLERTSQSCDKIQINTLH